MIMYNIERQAHRLRLLLGIIFRQRILSVDFTYTYPFLSFFSMIQLLVLVQQPKAIEKTLARECIVCMTEKSAEEFLDINNVSCKHVERTICNACIYENTKVLVENSMFSSEEVTCPEPNCNEILSFQTIRLILVIIGKNKELFERYDQDITYHHLLQRSDFIWCAYGCGSGQLHDFSAGLNSRVTCIKCNRCTCFKHRVVWHTNMTCDQYDLIENQSTETDANRKWLELCAKQCPHCRSYIQKNEGCDHMTCRYCRHEFCWLCLVDYQLIVSRGRNQHDIACSYYQS